MINNSDVKEATYQHRRHAYRPIVQDQAGHPTQRGNGTSILRGRPLQACWGLVFLPCLHPLPEWLVRSARHCPAVRNNKLMTRITAIHVAHPQGTQSGVGSVRRVLALLVVLDCLKTVPEARPSVSYVGSD